MKLIVMLAFIETFEYFAADAKNGEVDENVMRICGFGGRDESILSFVENFMMRSERILSDFKCVFKFSVE